MNNEQLLHHPIFDKFSFRLRDQSPGWHVNGLGIRTRESFADQSGWSAKISNTAMPEFNEAYFEWVDVLTAVHTAKDEFRMVELGAGFGPWLVLAAVALRQISDMPIQLIGAEAEKTRFEWMKMHFLDNGVSLDGHLFVNAALTATGKRTWFNVGDSDKTYGAGQVADANIPRISRNGIREWAHFQRARFIGRRKNSLRPELVAGCRLSQLLKPYDAVDLIDMDIQGAEAEVVQESIDELNLKVKMIHIGTHSDEIEETLASIFTKHKWENVWNFQNGHEQQTPYGIIKFSDGVQSWRNSRF